MKGDAGRSFEVFEFKEEDELPDIVPGKFLGRLKNAVGGDDAVLKYNYLGFVSNQMSLDNKVSSDLEFVDVDSVDTDHDYDDTCPSTEKFCGIDDITDDLSEPRQCASAVIAQKRILADHGSRSYCQDQHITSERVETCKENLQLIHDSVDCIFHSNDQRVDAMPLCSDERMSNSSPADLISDFTENNVYFDGCTPDPCASNQAIPNREITVLPDLVTLQDNYIWDPEMHFTSSGIQLTGFNTHEGNRARFEWSIDSIISIEAQWHERVQMTVIWINVLSEDPSAPNPSGIQEIKIMVSEIDWVKEQEKIISLNEKYKPLCVWNDVHLWPNQTLNERLYYPEFNDSFDELVYPKDDSDPVTISKRDIDLLQPETFINDTIIDFYIKYLKDRLETERAQKFHFFNSFFFRKLADLERSHFDASEGRNSFLRVRKWTRKVNLFEKDYIIIPVNSNLHWSLIVICHPGEIAKFEDKNVNGKHKVPCILHMDSIKGSHMGLKGHIQSYLWEEWKEKQNEVTEEIRSKFFNLRFISLEVPQQENSYDCGLFLLHYVELFLEEAPESFNPFRISKYSSFLNTDWFPPGDVSLKRAHIQRIIYYVNLNCAQSQQSYPPESEDRIGFQKSPETNNASGVDVELVRVRSNSPESYTRNLLCEASQEAKQSTLGSPSARNHMFANDSSLQFMHDQGTANGLPNDDPDRDFNLEPSNSQFNCYIASVEEIEARNDNPFLFSLANGAQFSSRPDPVSFQPEDYRLQHPWSTVNSMLAGIDTAENLECSRSLSHEHDDLVKMGNLGVDQMKDVKIPIKEDTENYDMGSTNLTENIGNVSKTDCCPSPTVLKAVSIKILDDSSQQTDICNMIDNPKDINPFSIIEQNEETPGEEMRVSKRARVETPDGVKYLTRSIAKDLLS